MKNWTMKKLDSEAKRIAASKMSVIDVRFALIAQYGHPER